MFSQPSPLATMQVVPFGRVIRKLKLPLSETSTSITLPFDSKPMAVGLSAYFLPRLSMKLWRESQMLCAQALDMKKAASKATIRKGA